jgi:alcohol dehydrogenase class IV
MMALSAYDFLAPRKIVFGWGRRHEVGSLARSLGQRAFLVCGSRTLWHNGTFAALRADLGRHHIATEHLATISHEPEVGDVDQAVVELMRLQAGPGDFLLACGGGSAIDLAKATAALATNRESDTVKDYLEGVGRGLKIVQPPLPLLAMPTTAGTGTEATKNAVISSYDPPFKKSLRSEQMVPAVVLVDPELTSSVPATTTAYTGMDAITQLLESYLSRHAKPIPQALCVQGLQLALPAIVEAVENGSHRPAREKMAQAALLSGLALANSGLGLAHGVAAALGVHCRMAHGLACAIMLPVALRVNREVRLRELADLSSLLLGRTFTSPDSAADALLEHIQLLCDRIGIPRQLSALGVQPSQVPELVQSSRGNSMSGNPRDVDDAELTRLLEALL